MFGPETVHDLKMSHLRKIQFSSSSLGRQLQCIPFVSSPSLWFDTPVCRILYNMRKPLEPPPLTSMNPDRLLVSNMWVHLCVYMRVWQQYVHIRNIYYYVTVYLCVYTWNYIRFQMQVHRMCVYVCMGWGLNSWYESVVVII